MGHKEPVLAQFRNLSALVVIKPSFIMPSIAIISPLALFPVQCAFLPLVDKAYGQNGQEHEYRPETHHANGAVGYGPGEEEGDFQVEHNEQDGDQVIANIEFHA